VATSLAKRVGRLERYATGDGGGDDEPPCPECGWPDDGADDDTTYEIVFVGEDEDLETPAFCETCGRQIPDIWFDDPEGPQREER
jgi:hypothetical protein